MSRIESARRPLAYRLGKEAVRLHKRRPVASAAVFFSLPKGIRRRVTHGTGSAGVVQPVDDSEPNNVYYGSTWALFTSLYLNNICNHHHSLAFCLMTSR